MDTLKKLELTKLVKELDFIESDYEYKSKLVQKADVEFLESVNQLVNTNPDLKEIYDAKVRNRLQDKTIQKVEESESILEEIEPEETSVPEKDPKIKNLYRSIVKKTHPDKVGDSNMNEFYIESTKYYNQDDLIALYKICDKLNIEYQFEENDYYLLQNKIQGIKDKIKFLEGTFTWLWINSDDQRKQEVVLNFVRLQIVQ